MIHSSGSMDWEGCQLLASAVLAGAIKAADEAAISLENPNFHLWCAVLDIEPEVVIEKFNRQHKA